MINHLDDIPIGVFAVEAFGAIAMGAGLVLDFDALQLYSQAKKKGQE